MTPSYTIEALLRPYPAAVNPAIAIALGSYHGVACTTPIMFTENGEALDGMAGRPGYSPRLARGLPVPMGARLIVWLPAIPVLNAASVCVGYYKWMFGWRLRSANDMQADPQAGSFHMGAVVEGVAETTVGNVGARVGRPAAWQPITYVPAEPAPGAGALASIANRAVSGLHPEDVYAELGELPQPKMPGVATSAQLQQGVSDPGGTLPGVIPLANMPLWTPHEVTALGDELLVGCYRAATVLLPADVNWDFSAAHSDRLFGLLFAANTHPQMGVRVFTGVAG